MLMDLRTIAAATLGSFLIAGCGGGGGDGDGGPITGSQTVTVRESTLGQNGVTEFHSAGSTGDLAFVAGPDVPPFGDGSLQMQTGADGDSGEELRFTVLDGDLLTDVSALDYWTFIQTGSGGQAPYLMLRIDWNADGLQDDLIFFEPDYQHGYTTNVPDQGDLVVGAWQSWDARQGGWWSLNDPTIAPGAGVRSLAFYAAAHPGARVVPGTDASGGLRLVVGYGAPAWNGFVGNADGLRAGTSGDNTTYDLEP
jgi:hypothetical protein